MRKATRTCMTPRRLATLEPDLRAFARGLVTRLPPAPSWTSSRRWLIRSRLTPGSGLLGFPDEAAQQISTWSDKRVLFTYGHLPDEEQVEVARMIVSFWNFIEEFVHQTDTHRRDDFTSDLLRYHDENPR